MRIETHKEELYLRQWRREDAESCVLYANDYHIWRYLRDDFPHPFTLKEAENYINNAIENCANTHFAIVYRDEVIGDIHININTDIRRFSGVLGYWLGEPFWGQGIMTEAIKAITAYAVTKLKLVRLYAKLFSNNVGSQKVLEKCGYKQEGYFTKAVYKEGLFLDQLHYAITDEMLS